VVWLSIGAANVSSLGQLIEHKILVSKIGLAAQETACPATISIICPEVNNNPQKISVGPKITEELHRESGKAPVHSLSTPKKGLFFLLKISRLATVERGI